MEHDWVCNRDIVLTSFPPQYGWTCRRCGMHVTVTCGQEPVKYGCKGGPESPESIRENDSYNLDPEKGSITYSPAQGTVTIASGAHAEPDECDSCGLHRTIDFYEQQVARYEKELAALEEKCSNQREQLRKFNDLFTRVGWERVDGKYVYMSGAKMYERIKRAENRCEKLVAQKRELQDEVARKDNALRAVAEGLAEIAGAIASSIPHSDDA